MQETYSIYMSLEVLGYLKYIDRSINIISLQELLQVIQGFGHPAHLCQKTDIVTMKLCLIAEICGFFEPLVALKQLPLKKVDQP